MSKKLAGQALAKFEAKRDVWQEVLDEVREIKARGKSRRRLWPSRSLYCARFIMQLYSDPYSASFSLKYRCKQLQ